MSTPSRPFSPPDPPPYLDLMHKMGLVPDPWQMEVLQAGHQRLLLNCCRQAGKSTVVAALALIEAIWHPMTRVLIVSRSLRQAKELLKQVTFFHRMLRDHNLARRTAEEIELNNLSRIVSLPCKEETIRGFAKVDLLIIDEAARVPDDLYRSVRPMLAVSGGRIVCLSTPHGKRGFFHDAWARGGDDWARIEIPASQISRIDPLFLERERRALGEAWFRQEYCCSFESVSGLVYPDFSRNVVTELPKNLQRLDGGTLAGLSDAERQKFLINMGFEHRKIVHTSPALLLPPVRYGAGDACHPIGGLDFGFRNPFAAIWGLLDRDGILWLTGEHYERQKPLSHHARFLPRDVEWYADPAAASDIAELRCANFTVKRGENALRPGIAAVSARLANGTLRVLKGRCPNLLYEAGLYRYSSDPHERSAEKPEDEHNHALAALRYLIMTIDRRKLARTTVQAEIRSEM